MNEFLKRQVLVSTAATPTGGNGPIVLTTTGDKFIFTPAAPVRLRKWGFIISTSLNTTGAALTCELDLRVTVGTDTGRVNKDTLTVAVTNTTYVAGKGVYRDPFTASSASTSTASQVTGSGPQGYTLNTVTSGQTDLYAVPGQEYVIEVTQGAGTAGQGYAFIEYDLLPLSKPSGYGTTDAGTVSLTDNLTRLAS